MISGFPKIDAAAAAVMSPLADGSFIVMASDPEKQDDAKGTGNYWDKLHDQT